MNSKTASESAFEEFCTLNQIFCEKIIEGTSPTPDYIVRLNGTNIHVEVKQIDDDANLSSALQLRTPGAHIRAKINQARNQVRSASAGGAPTILLVFNNLDPLQRFGTEQHDFMAAMYGDLTLFASRETRKTIGLFHGENKAFRKCKNDSFSAVGWLYKATTDVSVHLYENMHAKIPLDFKSLPSFITYNRFKEH